VDATQKAAAQTPVRSRRSGSETSRRASGVFAVQVGHG